MKLVISKVGSDFEVDNPEATGSPVVGRGRTMMEAIGNWLHGNQDKLNIEFEVHPSAQPAEQRRRQTAMARR